MVLSIKLSNRWSFFVRLKESIDSEETEIKEQNDPLLDWNLILQVYILRNKLISCSICICCVFTNAEYWSLVWRFFYSKGQNIKEFVNIIFEWDSIFLKQAPDIIEPDEESSEGKQSRATLSVGLGARHVPEEEVEKTHKVDVEAGEHESEDATQHKNVKVLQ